MLEAYASSEPILMPLHFRVGKRSRNVESLSRGSLNPTGEEQVAIIFCGTAVF